MKTALVVVLLCWYNLICFSQSALTQEQRMLILKQNAAALPALRPKQPGSSQAPGTRIITKQPADINSPIRNKNKFTPLEQAEKLCKDTSYRRLLGVNKGMLYLQSVTQTADHGILISAMMYDSTRLPQPSWRSFGLLLKIDEAGNTIWIKQFEDKTPGMFSTYLMYNAFELANHDIISVGLQKNDPNSDVYRSVVYRLNGNGDIIWQNSLQSTIGVIASPPGTFTFNVENAVDGRNGDVILSGMTYSGLSSGKFETVTRLNSKGEIIWDANFGNHGVDGSYRFGADGVTAFMKNGNIELVGVIHGSNNPITSPAINFYSLDYNTGSLLARRFFRPDYADKDVEFFKSFSYNYNKFVHLANGHFLFQGKLLSDYANYTPVIDHFGIVEFDSDFNFVNAYTISSKVKSYYYNDLLEFNAAGKGLVSISELTNTGETGNIFFGAFEEKQFQHQRKTNYGGVSLPGNTGFAFLQDNGYAFLQTYAIDQPPNWPKSYFEFTKMHNSDTASLCLGKDTLLFDFLPLNIIEDPGYTMWDPNEPNKLQAYSQNISQTDTISTSSLYVCLQKNYCDTIKIHGNPLVCPSQPSVVYTAFKNVACGASVQWDIDKNAIDSFRVLTDSSVRVWFKNRNWKGNLYASLTAGSCYAPVIDSLAITVSGLQPPNLGPDTLLCSKNEMILHAGNTFSSYRWQDGTKDSLYKVQNPGLYYVDVTDFCGGNYSDTIKINAADFLFSIGADTIRCNNDTLQLKATPGFTNYLWNTDYSISSTSGQSVKVYPGVDTSYIATAEKGPGCVVSDTIRIRVLNSPAIYLGKDTSLCTGQIITLNAGTAFTKYWWNTGSNNRQVIVSQKGTYSVSAMAANGCMSADTLEIVNVSPLPQFSLGTDTTICTGKVYSYKFNLQNATYLWQDGNTANKYTVDKPGQYILGVTQAGCTAIDTVIISYKASPVVYLGKDTSICTGSSYQLNAYFPAGTYKWQDGSQLPYLNISKGGMYSVAVELNGCVAADTQIVSTIPIPFFILGKDTVICAGQSFFLDPLLNTTANYRWQDGSTTPTFEVTRPNVYSLTAFNTCGSYAASIVITEGLCKLIMPNAFTPNGDGINDVFRVKHPFSVKEFLFVIYNRFGEKVFETKDMRQGWNGTYRSLNQNSGNYVWQIMLKGLNDQVETQKGSVILLR